MHIIWQKNPLSHFLSIFKVNITINFIKFAN